MIDLAVEHALVEKNGAYLSMGGETLGQGRERAREALAADVEKLARLRAGVTERCLGPRRDVKQAEAA